MLDSGTDFSSCTWTFKRERSNLIFECVRLHENGLISGIPEEFGVSWFIKSGILMFRAKDGSVRIGFRDHFIQPPHRFHRGGVPIAHPLYTGPDEKYELFPDGEDVGFLTRWTAYALRHHSSASRYDIGGYTYGIPNILQGGDARLIIGRFTSIGPNVTIGLGYHRTDSVSTYPFATIHQMSGDWPAANGLADHTHNGDISIGSDVWIGANAYIGSGVTIGHGAVIGASAVVTKDVPAYAIMGGNTARILRYRFGKDQIAALLDIKWWDWPIAIISANLPHICNENVDDFIRFARRWQLDR
ncbi:CatB-related O-acetyltransferase [Sphingobium yanoikuyae]|uniref:CatB-related O-acetyltransferase n=1 Tax=Sphingobium yanoikuyae TaxID=13690 RepID=UPI0012DA0A90|nr:CatB-related O-acetyltransferase [Sphingobium yanoikuyae]